MFNTEGGHKSEHVDECAKILMDTNQIKHLTDGSAIL